VQARQGRVFRADEVSAGFDAALTATGQQDWQVLFDVAVAVFHARAVHHDRVVQQAAVAFIDRFHFLQHAREHFDVPAADCCVLGDGGVLILVMRHAVVIAVHAVQEAEVLTAETPLRLRTLATETTEKLFDRTTLLPL
jgi:hypothetical protein